jgi:transcriptional regulator with XRE-family HTH domain
MESTGFGDMVKAHRERRGWSQQALAEQVGVSRVQVSRIEAGKRGVSSATFAALVRVLKLDRRAAMAAVEKAAA